MRLSCAFENITLFIHVLYIFLYQCGTLDIDIIETTWTSEADELAAHHPTSTSTSTTISIKH